MLTADAIVAVVCVCIQFNYCIDIEWLMLQYPAAFRYWHFVIFIYKM